MNKKLLSNEIIGGPGILVTSYTQDLNSQYINGDCYDIAKTQTSVALDTNQLGIQFDMYINGSRGKQNVYNQLQPLIEDQIKNTVDNQIKHILKNQVKFDMIAWIDKEGQPSATCQIFLNDKLIREQSSEKEDVRENPEFNV